MAESILESALRYAPEATYFSSAPFGRATADNHWGVSRFGAQGQQIQGAYSPSQQQYWGGQFGDVYNQFTGEQGRAAAAGQPMMSFADYLETYPFTQRFTSMAPSMRPGAGTSRFAPATRYVF